MAQARGAVSAALRMLCGAFPVQLRTAYPEPWPPSWPCLCCVEPLLPAPAAPPTLQRRGQHRCARQHPRRLVQRSLCQGPQLRVSRGGAGLRPSPY